MIYLPELDDGSDLHVPSDRKLSNEDGGEPLIPDERSILSGSLEQGEASLDRRYSWEDLSLSDYERNSVGSASDEEKENNRTSSNKPDTSMIFMIRRNIYDRACI